MTERNIDYGDEDDSNPEKIQRTTSEVKFIFYYNNEYLNFIFKK